MTSIWGSLMGNLIGTLYFLFFQITGLVLTCFFLRNKSIVTRLLAGSVLGSALLQWLPALFAFIFNFSITAHILAALFCGILIVILFILNCPHCTFVLPSANSLKIFLKKHFVFFALFLLTFIVFCLMLSSHTLVVREDGLHTGQCTYGDMNMHLGFITSIARQQTFPPYYSISPGDKLCYPFLCDSISSSIYIWGASLRYAFMLPMFFAIAQVMTGFYCIAYTWLQNTKKASLAWFFFFYNGGLGFVYFLDWSRERTYYFKNIFTEYYQTPTNLIDQNIRWVNIIVDMLLPQRATLFGYAVLFTCIWLLWRAVFRNEKDLFPVTALLTGSLPMIHTHSFLAMAFISAAWLLMSLFQSIRSKEKWKEPGKILFTGFLILMCLIQLLTKLENLITPNRLLYFCLTGLGLLVILGIYCLIKYIKANGCKTLLSTWGLYLLIILLLALPQLFGWTFGQTTQSGFNTGHFNWGNQGDNYLWFYIKNWGIILLLLIPAVFYCSRRNFAVLSASFLIWFTIELISFSPNTYDNNKLLYVAYLFFCCISAEYGYNIYRRLKGVKGIRLWSIVFLFLSCFSGILSMGRELVSDYTVYSNAHLEAALYIDKTASADATFLTNDRHVNEVAALAGRNIVSGAGIYLGPHGIYDNDRAQDVKLMYESPETSEELFEKHDVDYIMISSWERSNYSISEETFDTMFPLWFSNDEIKIYECH